MMLPTERIFLGKPPSPLGFAKPPFGSGSRPVCAFAAKVPAVTPATVTPAEAIKLKKSLRLDASCADFLYVKIAVGLAIGDVS